MKTRILLSALAALLLGAQDCESPPQDYGYCAGNDYSVLAGMSYAYDQGDGLTGGVGAAYDAILGGEPSDNRRGTVQVRFGQSYCSGVVLHEHLVLTAAHCGYGEATAHDVYIPTRIPSSDFVQLDGPYRASSHLPHPEYMEWVADPTKFGGRQADIMLLYVPDTLPPPYLGISFYHSALAKVCRGLVAQGLGRWEGSGLSLRETKYIINDEQDRSIRSVRAEEGKICFGDSGGPLYADVAGQIKVAGIASTTMSQDCLTGGTHVKVGNPAFQQWVQDNVVEP